MKMIGNVSDWLSYAGGALIKVADSAGSTVHLFFSVLVFNLQPHPTGMDPGARCHGMKLNPTGYLWSEYESPLIKSFQDIDF